MHLAASRRPILNLGFRPFFTGAAVFSVASMLAWAGMYLFGWLPYVTALPTTLWHAHEMIFGYTLAVIAGFLLTATANWTGLQASRVEPFGDGALPRQKIRARLGDGRELEFFVMSIDPEIVIANPAIGLQFRFRAEYYYRLIALRADEGA